MRERDLGTVFHDGETVFRQHEPGDCMYVVRSGTAEVIAESESGEIGLGTLGPGDFVGEMALFGGETRSATVRARGELTVLRVDKRTFLERVHQDPSLAFRVMEKMAERIREFDRRMAEGGD